MTDAVTVKPEENAKARKTHEALSTGLYIGALLIVVMLGSLVVADRISVAEPYALERNGISYGLFLAIMVYPVLRFLHRPLELFVSAMIGWVMFTAGYDLAGVYFRNLFQVLHTPFLVLVEGTIVYGVCAVGLWVGAMALRARRQTIVPDRRRRAHHIVPHEH